MISEKEHEEIRKEARRILDSFASAFEGVDTRQKRLKRVIGGFREEGAGGDADEKFRKIMFENAPDKEGDCIIAEKKKW